MLQIHRIVNEYQHSCTYILYVEDCEYIWLVDCGRAETVEEWLKAKEKRINGVFLTHCHDDHIYGLRRLVNKHPEIKVCLSAHDGIKGVQDVRLNLSRFTSEQFQLFSDYFVELKDGETVSLFPNVELIAIQADGHSPDSMVFRVENYLFTGDAYIPSLPVVTKLPGGNKKRAAESLETIMSLVANNKLTVLCGHDINWNK